jgi:ADP-heptose:LPS heptosyltransferase
MRRGAPDLVLDLFSNPRTALLTALSGAPVRVGLARSARRIAYNVRAPRFLGRPEDDHRWACDAMLDILRFAGISWSGEARLSVALEARDQEFAARALDALGVGSARFAAILPGGSWQEKRWTVNGFAEVARALARESGVRVLVSWGPPEESDARAIAERAGEGAILAPPSSIREMAAILERSSLFVSTDCFARHLAIAQGVPTVGIFGPTDPRGWTPPIGPHWSVGGPRSPYRGSTRAIPAEAVRDLALEAWGTRAGPAGAGALDARDAAS